MKKESSELRTDVRFPFKDHDIRVIKQKIAREHLIIVYLEKLAGCGGSIGRVLTFECVIAGFVPSQTVYFRARNV